MAFTSGDIAIIIVDGVDISQFTESVKFDRKAKDERHHVLGDNPVISVVHKPEHTVTAKGLIDPEVAALFSTNEGTNIEIPLVYQPQGADGLTRTCNVKVLDYTEDTDGTKTASWDATMAINGVVTDS